MTKQKEIVFSPEPERSYAFYGVDNVHFKLDGTVYLAREDESDGYRSLLDAIVIAKPKDLIFAQAPLAQVTVRMVRRDAAYLYDTFEGYEFVDASGHVWLTVGTSAFDGYYPMFTFRYMPKEV